MMGKKNKKNKRGISELVSYVLLIILTLSLASAVYAWLKILVQNPLPEEACPDGLALIMHHYECNTNARIINITVQNKGLFDISGYIVKFSNNESGMAGIYKLCRADKTYSGGEKCDNVIKFIQALVSGNTTMNNFSYAKYAPYTDPNYHNDAGLEAIKQLEIEPFLIIKKGTKEDYAYCDKATRKYSISGCG